MESDANNVNESWADKLSSDRAEGLSATSGPGAGFLGVSLAASAPHLDTIRVIQTLAEKQNTSAQRSYCSVV